MVEFGQVTEPLVHFVDICRLTDDKLEDARVFHREATDDVWSAASVFVSCGPGGSERSGVGEFWTDGHQVGIDIEEDGAGGFNGGSAAEEAALPREFREIGQK